MSQANNIRIAYRPAGSTGAWTILRHTGESLSPNPSTTESAEINTNRQVLENYLTELKTSGSIDIEFSALTFDDFLQAVFCSTYDASGNLLIGTTDTKFDILKSYTDLNQHVLFSDCVISSVDLKIDAVKIVTGSFGVMGTSVDTAYDPSADTFTDATTTRVINAASDVGSIQINGAALTGTAITSLEVKLDNSYKEETSVGSLTPTANYKGTANVTGNIDLAFTNDAYTLWANTVTNTDASLTFSITDGTNTYAVDVPKASLSGALPSGSKDSILEVKLAYTGLYDATTASALKITKS